MSGGPPPKGGGLVVLYENVKITITNGSVHVFVTLADGSEVSTSIDQASGQVVGGSNKPA